MAKFINVHCWRTGRNEYVQVDAIARIEPEENDIYKLVEKEHRSFFGNVTKREVSEFVSTKVGSTIFMKNSDDQTTVAESPEEVIELITKGEI